MTKKLPQMGLFLRFGLKVLEMFFGLRTKLCMRVWALGRQE